MMGCQQQAGQGGIVNGSRQKLTADIAPREDGTINSTAGLDLK